MSERSENEKKNITIFGTETEFNGVLEFRDKLIITGKFTGKINAPTGDLEIAKNAACDVESINAASIVVSGSVKGNMSAANRIEICSGSVVQSDITTARIRIANNVDFNGQVSMLDEEPSVNLFSVASSEFKQAMIIHSDVIK